MYFFFSLCKLQDRFEGSIFFLHGNCKFLLMGGGYIFCTVVVLLFGILVKMCDNYTLLINAYNMLSLYFNLFM